MNGSMTMIFWLYDDDILLISDFPEPAIKTCILQSQFVHINIHWQSDGVSRYSYKQRKMLHRHNPTHI